MENREQSARQANIAEIVAYFESGVKREAKGLGIELEHTLVKRDGAPVSYSEKHGVAWILEQLKGTHPNASYDADGDIVGVAAPGCAVTIEPAAQIELSAGPFTDLESAESCFADFEALLGSIVEPVDERVLTCGYHPTSTARDLELIPKRRYKFMNAYLGAISPFGICMMRGSASTQISIDYTSAEDCLRKLRIALALTPMLSLICDNSPVFEAGPREHQLVRTEIWKYCDPDRCGIVPGALSPSFTLEDYAAYILDTPAILVPDGAGSWREDARTFGEIYASTPMTRSEVEHACSMFFTDVRLKTYLEIRPADAMPIPYAIAYAALIKGLFYNERSLVALESAFEGVTESDVAAAKEALMQSGYDACVYGTSASDLADLIVGTARRGLDDEDASCLEPLERLVSERTTLACLAEKKAAHTTENAF